MATLSEYFETQARDVLQRLERGLQEKPLPDPAELHRAARELRGTAQMAREDRVFRAVGAFEAVARALAGNALTWSEEVAGRARDTIADLRALVEADGTDDELDARTDAAVQRWSASGVDMTPASGPAAASDGVSASSEFRAFAAREIAGISDALDAGVQQMAASPMDREPLRMILRRQRALLGAARLDEIPVVAEILRAVEDLTRVIAKLDVGVKQEWLDIYRVAREGLKATIEPLQRDENPQPTHALSRLRHMREELLERYGAGEAVSAAHESAGLVQAQTAAEPPEPRQFDVEADSGPEPQAADEPELEELLLLEDQVIELEDEVAGPEAAAATAGAGAIGSDAPDAGAGEPDAADAGAIGSDAPEPQAAGADEQGVVPIEDLCYRGDAALRRALELQDVITRAAADDPQASAAVDELFDLIRSARP